MREPRPHGLRSKPGQLVPEEDIATCDGCGGRMLRIGLCQTHGLCGWCHDEDGITPRPRRGRAAGDHARQGGDGPAGGDPAAGR